MKNWLLLNEKSGWKILKETRKSTILRESAGKLFTKLFTKVSFFLFVFHHFFSIFLISNKHRTYIHLLYLQRFFFPMVDRKYGGSPFFFLLLPLLLLLTSFLLSISFYTHWLDVSTYAWFRLAKGRLNENRRVNETLVSFSFFFKGLMNGPWYSEFIFSSTLIVLLQFGKKIFSRGLRFTFINYFLAWFDKMTLPALNFQGCVWFLTLTFLSMKFVVKIIAWSRSPLLSLKESNINELFEG